MAAMALADCRSAGLDLAAGVGVLDLVPTLGRISVQSLMMQDAKVVTTILHMLQQNNLLPRLFAILGQIFPRPRPYLLCFNR